MVKRFLSFGTFVLLTTILFAQETYELHWKKELPYIGVGIGTIVIGEFVLNNSPFLIAEELGTFNPSDVNSFDRFSTDKFSHNADQLSDVFVYSSHAVPYLLLAGKKSRKQFGKIMAMYGEAASINIGITLMTKNITRRPRPYSYNDAVSNEFKLSNKAKTSFISGHTSMTALNTFFVAKVYSDLYPDSDWKPVVWTLAATIPAATGLLRVEAGKHFPTDVIAGYAVGATIGILIPQLHRNKGWDDNGLRMDFGLSSAYLCWQFNKRKRL